MTYTLAEFCDDCRATLKADTGPGPAPPSVRRHSVMSVCAVTCPYTAHEAP